LLHYLGDEHNMLELVEYHLVRVKDGVREFSSRENLINRITQYTDSIKQFGANDI